MNSSLTSVPNQHSISPANNAEPISRSPSASTHTIPSAQEDAPIPSMSTTAAISPPISLQPKPPTTLAPSTSTPTPRLRSSIACARCRKSKIKCTNTGTGTTCEACAHSGRECIYPAPGANSKREGDGEDGERVKRPRVRKLEPQQGHATLNFTIAADSPALAKAQVRQDKSIWTKTNLAQMLTLSPKSWHEIFELFQLHYGTELSFLHAPTFLPKLADDPAVYAAMTGMQTSEDTTSFQLLQLGILTLTVQYHNGLNQKYAINAENGSSSNPLQAAGDHFANILKSLLFQDGDAKTTASIEQSSLAKVQALLMLAMYEWSLRRGRSAWLYLGIAIRMAQSMNIMSEDLDIPSTSIPPLLGSVSSALLRNVSRGQHDIDSSEATILEEITRRTVWSCFLLDRYFSNGFCRPSSITSKKLFVQMPCGEKSWAFGDRVCTPFFDGTCSHHRDRARRKLDQSSTTERRESSSSMISNMISRIPCEYDQDEGLISRFVRLVDIWGSIAQWSYASGKASGPHAPWDERSQYWNLQSDLQQFYDEMPRSFRYTKVNSQAHLAQHTSPPFTLLHIVYSISKLVLLREFLPFAPTNIYSPLHLDDLEIREQNIYNRRWHSTTLAELFKISHDFLDLIQTCKPRSLLPLNPMSSFGVYLVVFVGIYAVHFPQMDVGGLVYGNNMEPNVRTDRETKIIDALDILVSMRPLQPMARYWFRTLHRAHLYYKSVSKSDQSNEFHDRLTTLFTTLGSQEEAQLTYTATTTQSEHTTLKHSFRDGLPSPQPSWKPVNALSSKFIDPLDRPAPQLASHSLTSWHQARGDPSDPRNPISNKSTSSPGFDASTPASYSAPHNTLPPLQPRNGISLFGQSSPGLSSGGSIQQQGQMTLSFSGEDVALFVDARSEEEVAAIGTAWGMIKGGEEPGFSGSPGQRMAGAKRIASFASGWLGGLWQW